MWALVEMPGRRLMLKIGGQKKIHGTKVMKKSWKHHLNWNRHTVTVSILLFGVLTSVYFSMGNIQRIDAMIADQMTPSSLQVYKGAEFGGLFKLRGLNIFRDTDGLHVELAWESLVKQKLGYTNALQIKGESNEVVAWGDYKQPMTRMAVEAGTIWKDSIFLPNEKFSGEGVQLVLGLYKKEPLRVLSVRGIARYSGNWLIIPLDHY